MKIQAVRFCYTILRIILLSSEERLGQAFIRSTNSGCFSMIDAKYDAKSLFTFFVSSLLVEDLGVLCSGFVNY